MLSSVQIHGRNWTESSPLWILQSHGEDLKEMHTEIHKYASFRIIHIIMTWSRSMREFIVSHLGKAFVITWGCIMKLPWTSGKVKRARLLTGCQRQLVQFLVYSWHPNVLPSSSWVSSTRDSGWQMHCRKRQTLGMELMEPLTIASYYARRNCSMFLLSCHKSVKMPGNLGLAMKELDAAEESCDFFRFLRAVQLTAAQGTSSKASQSHTSFKGSRSLWATLANWWEIPGRSAIKVIKVKVDVGLRIFMHQQEWRVIVFSSLFVGSLVTQATLVKRCLHLHGSLILMHGAQHHLLQWQVFSLGVD